MFFLNATSCANWRLLKWVEDILSAWARLKEGPCKYEPIFHGVNNNIWAEHLTCPESFRSLLNFYVRHTFQIFFFQWFHFACFLIHKLNNDGFGLPLCKFCSWTQGYILHCKINRLVDHKEFWPHRVIPRLFGKSRWVITSSIRDSFIKTYEFVLKVKILVGNSNPLQPECRYLYVDIDWLGYILYVQDLTARYNLYKTEQVRK